MPVRSTTSPKHKWLLLPDNWDDCWKTAKAASTSGSNQAWVTIIGDSVSNGQASSDWMSKGFFEQIRTSLTASYPLWADYWPQYAYSSIISGWAGTAPWGGVLNAHANANFTSTGWHGMQWQNDTGQTAYQTFTSPYACTDMDVNWEDLSACTWKYQVDSGSLVSVTGTGGGTASTTTIKQIQLTGLANTTHTFTHGWYSVAEAANVMGVTTYKGSRTAAGLGFGRCATGGFAAKHYTQAGFPGNRPELFQGKTPQNDGTNNTGFGFPTQPHLAIIELGINEAGDANQGAYMNNLDRLIQALRRGQSGCSIILLGPWFGNGLSTDCAPTQGGGTNWNFYLGGMTELAADYSCAFVSIHAKWGSNPLAQGFVTSSTNLHPTDAGHTDIANTLLGII